MPRFRNVIDLSAIVRDARGLRSWTQKDLAHHAGVSREFIVQLESGKHRRAELALVLTVLETLGVTLVATWGVQSEVVSHTDPGSAISLDDVLANVGNGSAL